MILITTSRRPSPRTRSLCNDLAWLLPDSFRINRGNASSDELLVLASVKGAKTLIVIDSKMGNPSAISLYSIGEEAGRSASIRFRVSQVRLQREVGKKTAKIRLFKRLVVRLREGRMETATFARVLARFLQGEFAQCVCAERSYDMPTNACLVLKVEEIEDEISLRFTDMDSIVEYGPQIKIRIRDISNLNLEGISHD